MKPAHAPLIQRNTFLYHPDTFWCHLRHPQRAPHQYFKLTEI